MARGDSCEYCMNMRGQNQCEVYIKKTANMSLTLKEKITE